MVNSTGFYNNPFNQAFNLADPFNCPQENNNEAFIMDSFDWNQENNPQSNIDLEINDFSVQENDYQGILDFNNFPIQENSPQKKLDFEVNNYEIQENTAQIPSNLTEPNSSTGLENQLPQSHEIPTKSNTNKKKKTEKKIQKLSNAVQETPEKKNVPENINKFLFEFNLNENVNQIDNASFNKNNSCLTNFDSLPELGNPISTNSTPNTSKKKRKSKEIQDDTKLKKNSEKKVERKTKEKTQKIAETTLKEPSKKTKNQSALQSSVKSNAELNTNDNVVIQQNQELDRAETVQNHGINPEYQKIIAELSKENRLFKDKYDCLTILFDSMKNKCIELSNENNLLKNENEKLETKYGVNRIQSKNQERSFQERELYFQLISNANSIYSEKIKVLENQLMQREQQMQEENRIKQKLEHELKILNIQYQLMLNARNLNNYK